MGPRGPRRDDGEFDAQNRVGYCFEQASLALNKHNPHLRVFFCVEESCSLFEKALMEIKTITDKFNELWQSC